MEFKDGSKKIFGITCFHCVVLNHSSLLNWQQSGINPHDSANYPRADQPSLSDHEETLRHIEEQLRVTNSDAHNAVRNRLKDPNEFILPSEERLFNIRENSIQEFEKERATALTFASKKNFYLGKVYAASRKRISLRNLTVDWALIDIKENRTSTNDVVNASSLDIENMLTIS